MEKSNLENVNEKLLIAIVETMLDEVTDNDGIVNVYETDTMVVFDTYLDTLKAFGIKGETIDVDYLYNFILLNLSELENKQYTNGLKRPNAQEYIIDAKVHEIVTQTVTYRHKVTSYSKGTVKNKILFEESEGFTSVWEGNHIDTDVWDSETNSVDWGEPVLAKKK